MKKIKILGNDWTLEVKKKVSGGHFNATTRKIEIGSIGLMENFMHEVAEAIMVERLLRYMQYVDDTNDGIAFVFDHKQFSLFCQDLLTALTPIFIKNPLSALPNVGRDKKVVKRLTKVRKYAKSKSKTARVK